MICDPSTSACSPGTFSRLTDRFPPAFRQCFNWPIIFFKYLFGVNLLTFANSNKQLPQLPKPNPEQLLHERLDAGDFEGALQLASEHDLNTDLVYELQWTNSAVDQTSIDSFLSNVQDTHWVLDQCINRLADDFSSNLALIEHGLQLTELRHVLSSDPNDVSVEGLHELPYEEYTRRVQQRIQEKKDKLLLEVIEQPTARQQFLLIARLNLLRHKQRLLLYERICNEQQQLFDLTEYERFRTCSLLKSAIQSSNDGHWKALRILFTYAGHELLPHRLLILSHVPETVSPFNYQALLPQCPPDDDLEQSYPWEQIQLLELDWSHQHFQSLDPNLLSDSDFENQLYSEQSKFLEFKCDLLPTKTQLSVWFKWRARQIENLSGLVSNALALLAIGVRQNVPNLDSLRDDLHTFETLVYEVFPNRPHLNQSLEQFERLPLQAKLDLLMYKCTEHPNNFLQLVQKNLLPFLQRYANSSLITQQKLLQDFFLSTLGNDIILLGIYLKQLKQMNVNESNRLLKNPTVIKNVVFHSLYGNLSPEHLLIAQQILDAVEEIIDQENNNEDDKQELIDLKFKLKGSKLLQKLNKFMNPKQLKELVDCSSSKEKVTQLFVAIIKKSVNIKPIQRKFWNEMMKDFLELRQLLFDSVLDSDELWILGIRTLLTSNYQSNIDIACEYLNLENNKNEISSNNDSDCEGWDFDINCELVNDDSIGSQSVDSAVEANAISPETAVSLLITAAVDYLCAAESIKDRSAELGAHCLRKIPTKFCNQDEVRAEFDFLSAMKLLHEQFDVKLLPVQLRLLPYPKTDAIKAAALSVTKGYRKLEALLTLAKLLRVFEGRPDEYRDTHVILLSGDMAIENGDYAHCSACCRIFIQQNIAQGWKLCQRLGSCEQFDDLRLRHQFLSFAIANCDEDGAQLQLLLDQLRKLKLQLNQKSTDQGVSRLLASKTSHVSDQIKQQTQHVAKATGQLAGWLLRNLMPEELNANKHEQLERLAAEEAYESELLSKHASAAHFSNSIFVSSFYESAFIDAKSLLRIQSQDGSYSGFYLPEVDNEMNESSNKTRPLPVAQLLLRTSMLSETRACKRRVETLLRQLSRSALQHDTALALAYLFSVTDVRRGQTVFSPLSQCPDLLLIVAEYAVSVRFGQNQVEPLSLFDKSIDEAILQANELPKSNLTKTDRDCQMLLSQYNNRRQFLSKADRVRFICPNIPIDRFLNDIAYRRETLLGLSLTDCEQTLKSVVNLALEFHVPLFDVYLAHTEHLLTEAQLSLQELNTRIFDNLELFSALLEQNEETTQALEKRVRPLLDGNDYEKLHLYFQVLARINSQAEKQQTEKFICHANNLQILMRIFPKESTRLDYLKLVDMRKPAFELLFAVLDEQNHLRVAKGLQALKLDIDQPLTASAVHSLWLRKYLLDATHNNWNRDLFAQVWPTVRRLLPDDLLLFSNFFVFSVETERRNLSMKDRKYVVNQMIRQATLKAEKSDESTEQSQSKWTECLNELNRRLDLLAKST